MPLLARWNEAPAAPWGTVRDRPGASLWNGRGSHSVEGAARFADPTAVRRQGKSSVPRDRVPYKPDARGGPSRAKAHRRAGPVRTQAGTPPARGINRPAPTRVVALANSLTQLMSDVIDHGAGRGRTVGLEPIKRRHAPIGRGILQSSVRWRVERRQVVRTGEVPRSAVWPDRPLRRGDVRSSTLGGLVGWAGNGCGAVSAGDPRGSRTLLMCHSASGTYWARRAVRQNDFGHPMYGDAQRVRPRTGAETPMCVGRSLPLLFR